MLRTTRIARGSHDRLKRRPVARNNDSSRTSPASQAPKKTSMYPNMPSPDFQNPKESELLAK